MADTFCLEIHEVRKGFWAFFLIVLFGCWLAGQTNGEVSDPTWRNYGFGIPTTRTDYFQPTNKSWPDRNPNSVEIMEFVEIRN